MNISYRLKRTRHETRVYNKRMEEVSSKFEEVALYEWTLPGVLVKIFKITLRLLYNITQKTYLDFHKND